MDLRPHRFAANHATALSPTFPAREFPLRIKAAGCYHIQELEVSFKPLFTASGLVLNRLLLNRKLWLIPALLWLVLVGLSYVWTVSEMSRHVEETIAHQARFVFKMVEATRQWNALHGGVYGGQSETTPSNPYLHVAEKDLVTPSGRRLTLLNPAYMTRQLAEVIHEQIGIRIHITSLKPINPGNSPNRWEAGALHRFDQGELEYFAVNGTPGLPMARFMAPLVTKQACLKCHSHQGYKVGDIRGGISVSFPVKTMLADLDLRKRQSAGIHIGVWLLLSGLTLLALHLVRRQLLSLTAAEAQQGQLVEQRTVELSTEVRERREAETSLRMLINFSGEGIFGLDRSGRFTFINPVAVRLMGHLAADELLGQAMPSLFLRAAAVEPADGETDNPAARITGVLRDGLPLHEEEAWFTRADGSRLAVEYRAHPLISEGEILGVVVTFSDITQRKQAQDRIWRQANYDALTGLPNRDLLDDRLERALSQARRRDSQVAVLFVDLDNFKSANDQFGHDAGDTILREAARRMAACLRDTDTVARLGGDEFLIVLPLLESRQDAEFVAEKVVEQLAQPFVLPTGTAQISASIGIAYFPEDADTADKLLRNADHAMYRAKDAGRGTYRVFKNFGA